MKMVLKSLVVLGLLAVTTVGHAQETQTPVAPIQLSPDVKQGIGLLAKGFGVDLSKKDEVPKQVSDKKQAPTATVPEKNIADVADRALDLVEQGSRYMEEHIKKIAPEVWRIMVRQQYAVAIGDPLLAVGWLLMAIMAHYILRATWPIAPGMSNDERSVRVFIVSILPTFVGLASFLFVMGYMTTSVKLLFNPEYYAVKDLIRVMLAR